MRHETHDGHDQHVHAERVLRTLATLNAALWCIALVALVFVLERGRGVEGLFPIGAAGLAAGLGVMAHVARRA